MNCLFDVLPIEIIIKRAQSANEMTASPRALEWAEKLNSIGARDISELTPKEAREEDERTSLPFLTKPEPVEKIENHTIREGLSEIPVRVYWPKSTGDEQDMYPIIVYFHGGGWVVGKLDLFDELCSVLANRAEAIVISVNYRLAPESKFPAGLHDCYSATKWVADNAEFLEGDRDTIIVGGDSAGGNLAAAVSLMAKEKNGPQIAAQLLIYPITDLASDLSEYSKYKFGLSKGIMDWFGRNYLKHDSEMKDPLV
jgi:acetyl esterase